MIGYVEHITEAGERWDQIAFRYYGDAHGYERIIAANPTVPIAPALPGGVRLAVPIVARATALPAESLPPWKR